MFIGRLGEAAAPVADVRGPCPDFASNSMAFALLLRKITENLSQGSRKALSSSALYAIRSVYLVITIDGLEWPAARAALGFRVRRRGQPSFSLSIRPPAIIGGSPHQLTLSQS